MNRKERRAAGAGHGPEVEHLADVNYVALLAEAPCGTHFAVRCPCGCTRLQEACFPAADILEHDRAAKRLLVKVRGREVAPRSPSRPRIN